MKNSTTYLIWSQVGFGSGVTIGILAGVIIQRTTMAIWGLGEAVILTGYFILRRFKK